MTKLLTKNFIYQAKHCIPMTTMFDIEQKCPVCGKVSSHQVLGSTNTMDYPDLDLRPAEMQRSTMNTWIDECPHCGYVSGDFRNETSIDEEFLKSESYLTCDGIEFIGYLSKRFYRAYMIAREMKDSNKCFFNLLHCAWDCDDKNDSNAVKMRKLALEHFDDLEYDENEKKNYLAIKADLLRRSGQFDQVIEEFSGITIGEEPYDLIFQFQIEKSKEKDAECYTVGDAKNRMSDSPF